MYRYVRPRPNASLHRKQVVPKSIGKAFDLYAYSTANTEEERQRLELKFFGPIDNLAAEALQKIDSGTAGSIADKVGLVQFVLSLQWRSPERITHLRNDLSGRMTGVADFDAHSQAHQTMIADHINELLSDMISSENAVRVVSGMKIFRIDVDSKNKLLTCDLPLMMSQGVAQPQGFMMFPYSPHRVVIFAHNEKVASAFSSREPDALANALNDAIVRQARQFVIAADPSLEQFVDERFLKYSEPIPGDGLIRWSIP
jgi:Protein of unknown function (DUF4238)